jgi:catalase
MVDLPSCTTLLRCCFQQRARLAKDKPSKVFGSDAFAHCKFIAFSEDAQALLETAGIASELDEGCIKIQARKDAADFITTCGKLRHWGRERSVDLDA